MKGSVQGPKLLACLLLSHPRRGVVRSIPEMQPRDIETDTDDSFQNIAAHAPLQGTSHMRARRSLQVNMSILNDGGCKVGVSRRARMWGGNNSQF